MQLILDTNGLAIKIRNKCFWIIGKKFQRQISPHRISSISVTADCLVSTSAIRLAVKHGIPIYFSGRYGKTVAKLSSPNFGNIASLRRQQVLFAESIDAGKWVVDLFDWKYGNKIRLLTNLKKINPGRLEDIRTAINKIEDIRTSTTEVLPATIPGIRSTLLGKEGSAARIYWQTISSILPPEWQFEKRSRRPAKDPFNATLNYLYGMMYGVVDGAVMAAGLDPYLGFFHTDDYKRPTLVFDLIEPFRPWIDALLLDFIFDQKLLPTQFDFNEEGVRIGKAAKSIVIPLFYEYINQSIRFRNKQLSRKNHIYRFVGEFAKMLLEWNKTETL